MAITKLILLKDVEDLGLAGEEVHVSTGYARNFLIPKKLAAPASASALKQIAARKEKIEAERQAALEAAQALAAKIAETAVNINMQASDDGHLFGSVTDRAIAEAYAAAGIVFDHQRVRLEAPIRATGEYSVNIKLHQSVMATGKVIIGRI